MAKKKKKRFRNKDFGKLNCHHLLFQRRYWNTGYAYLLREHQYFKIEIPIYSLHEIIHKQISFVPVPEEKWCAYAYKILENRLRFGVLSMEDHYWKRLDFLIEIWEGYCEQTTSILNYERFLIYNFYNKTP